MPIANGLCGCNFKESYRSPAGYIAELERDAKRYRWLRERDLETISNGGVFAGITPDNHVLNGVDLDEAIDKAM
jgi:hypothetical protein